MAGKDDPENLDQKAGLIIILQWLMSFNFSWKIVSMKQSFIAHTGRELGAGHWMVWPLSLKSYKIVKKRGTGSVGAGWPFFTLHSSVTDSWDKGPGDQKIKKKTKLAQDSLHKKCITLNTGTGGGVWQSQQSSKVIIQCDKVSQRKTHQCCIGVKGYLRCIAHWYSCLGINDSRVDLAKYSLDNDTELSFFHRRLRKPWICPTLIDSRGLLAHGFQLVVFISYFWFCCFFFLWTFLFEHQRGFLKVVESCKKNGHLCYLHFTIKSHKFAYVNLYTIHALKAKGVLIEAWWYLHSHINALSVTEL